MIVLRQGRAIRSSTAHHGLGALYQSYLSGALMCSPFGALRNMELSSIRYFSHRPLWRAPPPSPFMFGKQSVSRFSTLNIYRHPLGKAQIGGPLLEGKPDNICSMRGLRLLDPKRTLSPLSVMADFQMRIYTEPLDKAAYARRAASYHQPCCIRR